MSYEKFKQPLDAMHVVSRAQGVRTSLTDDQLRKAQQRIAQGEDIDVVVEDLAQEKERELP